MFQLHLEIFFSQHYFIDKPFLNSRNLMAPHPSKNKQINQNKTHTKKKPEQKTKKLSH